jgi:Protein of unknown function (DUF2510)
MNARPAGWERDPSGRHEHRYWDGASWTQDVADQGITSVDPFDPVGAGETTAPVDPTRPYPAEARSGPSADPSPPRSGPSLALVAGLAAAAIAVIVGVVVLVTAGGDGDDGGGTTAGGTGSGDDATVSELADTFVTSAGLDEEQAECLAQVMVDEIGADRLGELQATGDFTTLTAEDLTAVIGAVSECGITQLPTGLGPEG